MIGYGRTDDPKSYFDHLANRSPTTFDPTDGRDFESMGFTHIYWQWADDEPRGEPGDSGGPVVNEFAGGWWISGVVSGPVGFSARIGRAESVIEWIKNPSPPAVAVGSAGHFINAKSALCLSPWAGALAQVPCFDARQVWTLQSTNLAGFFRLRSPMGKCLGIPENNNASGTTAEFQTCTTSNYQKWQITSRGLLDHPGGGDTAPGYRYYQLKVRGNGATNLCLQPNAGSVLFGQQLKQVTCAAIASPIGHPQAWTFTRR